jgi:LPPG:FO 2-phospho-L-lactate transferase
MTFKVVAFAGGVGGAKLADGLARLLNPENLTIIVNTGDDFDFAGLHICADLDTVCYTLAGIANPDTGWGQKDETWNTLTAWSRLGGPDWFHLGDRDLATHLERTRLLQQGLSLSEVIARLCRKWQIRPTVLPMTDDPVSTKIKTNTGEILDFQDYFVRQSWQPVVKEIIFANAETSKPAPGVLEAIHSADLVVVCPSNPLVSVDPILAIPGIRAEAMQKPVVALSPIVGGKAIKGPLAKMIQELFGVDPSAAWVADYYQQHFRLDGFLLDSQDGQMLPSLTRQVIICKAVPSIMLNEKDRIEVAKQVLTFSKILLGRE